MNIYMVAINESGIVRTMVESHFAIAEPCAVALARVRQIVVVSHRWVSPHNPNVGTHETGERLEVIRAFWTEHTEILNVWFEFGCLPQRKKDSDKESQRVVLARNGFHCLHIQCAGAGKKTGSHWLNVGASLTVPRACTRCLAHKAKGHEKARRPGPTG